ncbi:MAG: 23S rRNA pseudouridine(1911/1915/1917) synthase RluD [Cellvibrionaceae bacterium]
MNTVNSRDQPQTATVPDDLLGLRLDQVATTLFPRYSRGRLQAWIKNGALTVDGRPGKAKQKLTGGECLTLIAEEEPQGDWIAQEIPLDIVFEDQHLLVLNKSAGLVVHPAAGNASGTLLNALMHYYPELVNLPRGGIVHRLDKDTTGLMVVAKTLASHRSLVAQLQARTVERRYEAVAMGSLHGAGTIDAPIGRHPRQRKKMAVVSRGGKEAVTHYDIAKRFPNHTYLRLKLETGRTHQIRVHLAHIGHPLVGDATYGGRRQLPKSASSALVKAVQDLGRQALHARRLALVHPQSGERQSWEAPTPADLSALLDALAIEEAK